MNVPGDSQVEREVGVPAFGSRGGPGGTASPDLAPVPPGIFRIRLVYEVEGCDDPFEAIAELLAGLNDLRPDVHVRLVDSGVIPG